MKTLFSSGIGLALPYALDTFFPDILRGFSKRAKSGLRLDFGF
jgi:hypothetical protein